MVVKISGVAPHVDGDYELDLASFTNRELHRIKQISGVRGAEVIDAVFAGDAAFACAVAAIVCQRAGKRVSEDFFLDAPGGVVHFDFPALAEDDGDPPTSVPRKRGTKKSSSGSGSESS